MARKSVAHKTFNKTLAVAGEVEDLVVIRTDNMTEANKLSLITNRDIIVAFDRADCTLDSGLEILAGEGYYDDDITITDSITFVNKNPGERPRVRGIVWGN